LKLVLVEVLNCDGGREGAVGFGGERFFGRSRLAGFDSDLYLSGIDECRSNVLMKLYDGWGTAHRSLLFWRF
jgi:hypothetical protein